MQVTVETTEGLERRMTIAVPAERVDSEVDSRLKTYARQMRMDGFRPGKVPVRVVKKQFGAQIRQEVLGDVIQSSLQEAFVQENVSPAGMPSVEPVNDKAGEEFSYTATFEVYPEVEIADASALKIDCNTAEITDTDMDAMMEKLLKQQASWEPKEGAAEMGDRVVVDYKGSLEDGSEFPGNERNDAAVVLGSGSLGEDFEAKLVGATTDGDMNFDVSFPDDYRIDELAGKAVHFEVQVKNVLTEKLPELNDDFAVLLGIQEGGAAALTEQVKTNMQRELSQKLRSSVKDNVMEALLNANPIDLPKAVVEEEAKRLQEQMVQQMKPAAGGKLPDIPTSIFEPQAARRVSLGLLVGEIIKTNDMKVEDDRVRTLVQTIADTYERPDEVVESYYADEKMLSEVQALAMEEQVVDWILDKAEVTDVPMSFDEIMNPPTPETDSEEDSK